MTFEDFAVLALFVGVPLNLLVFSWIGLVMGKVSRGNGALGWAVGATLGPLGLLLIPLMKDERRKCPQCATNCDRQARICSRCLATLPPVPLRYGEKPPADVAPESKR